MDDSNARPAQRKGQSGMEYMMTYGWAILVVMVVGVVLWQMGIFDTTKNIAPGKTGFSEVRPFDWKVSSNTIEVYVLNDAGSRVNLTGVLSSPCGTNYTGPIIEFSPADINSVTLSDCDSLPDGMGEYYRVDITINYTKLASGMQHLSSGEVWGLIE